MLPMPAKTPHLFCAVHNMQNVALNVTGGNVGQ
jgi:hypothetical protein